MSAFPFEIFHIFFRRCIRSGNLQAEQIRNRCIEKSKYQLPSTCCGTVIENKVQLMLEARKNNDRQLKFVNKGDRWRKNWYSITMSCLINSQIIFSLIKEKLKGLAVDSYKKKLCLLLLILLQTV